MWCCCASGIVTGCRAIAQRQPGRTVPDKRPGRRPPLLIHVLGLQGLQATLTRCPADRCGALSARPARRAGEGIARARIHTHEQLRN